MKKDLSACFCFLKLIQPETKRRRDTLTLLHAERETGEKAPDVKKWTNRNWKQNEESLDEEGWSRGVAALSSLGEWMKCWLLLAAARGLEREKWLAQKFEKSRKKRRAEVVFTGERSIRMFWIKEMEETNWIERLGWATWFASIHSLNASKSFGLLFFSWQELYEACRDIFQTWNIMLHVIYHMASKSQNRLHVGSWLVHTKMKYQVYKPREKAWFEYLLES